MERKTQGLSRPRVWRIASIFGRWDCPRQFPVVVGLCRYEAVPAIFSTSVLHHEVAGYNAVLDILEIEDWRRQVLHANYAYLRMALAERGDNVIHSQSHIISLEAGEVRQTVLVRDALEARGIFGSLFFAPAVPEQRCLLRFTVNCGLTKEKLDSGVTVCRDIRDAVDMWNWPSTRRKPRELARQAHLPKEGAISAVAYNDAGTERFQRFSMLGFGNWEGNPKLRALPDF